MFTVATSCVCIYNMTVEKRRDFYARDNNERDFALFDENFEISKISFAELPPG